MQERQTTLTFKETLMGNCYHYDLHETGECPKCKAQVTVEPSVSTLIKIGWSEEPALTGRINTPDRPTAREALATALGVAVEAIAIEDVTVTESYARSGMTVRFHLTGSKAVIQAVLDSNDTTLKTPNRVEYEEG